MTQKSLIMKYVMRFGSILPAKMAGHVMWRNMFGSETSRRCRELRAEGLLISQGEKRFERFYLAG